MWEDHQERDTEALIDECRKYRARKKEERVINRNRERRYRNKQERRKNLGLRKLGRRFLKNQKS